MPQKLKIEPFITEKCIPQDYLYKVKIEENWGLVLKW